jgi:hypothetical protein
VSAPQSDEGAAQQAEHERVMGEVSDVLLNLEHALDRTRKALRVASKSGAEPNVELALGQAAKDLDALRKRLMQDTYFGGDVLRLL